MMSSEDITEQLVETCVVDPQSEEVEIEEMTVSNNDGNNSQYIVLEHNIVTEGSSPYVITQNINHDNNQIDLTTMTTTNSLMEISSINEEVITTDSEGQINFINPSSSENVVITCYKLILPNGTTSDINNTEVISHNIHQTDPSQLKEVSPCQEEIDLFNEKATLDDSDNKVDIKTTLTNNSVSKYCLISENNTYRLISEQTDSNGDKSFPSSAECIEIPESFYQQIIHSLGTKKELYSAPSIMSGNLPNFNFYPDSLQTFNNSVTGVSADDNVDFNDIDRKPIRINNDNNDNTTTNNNLMDLSEFRNEIHYNDDEEEEEEEEEEGDNVRDKGGNVITYTILPGCSTRGRDLLVDSRGYSYANKPTNSKKAGAASYWRCVRRSKKTYCHASVIEKHGLYRPGRHSHSHPPKAGELLKRRIYAEAKCLKTANNDISLSDVIGIIASETSETELNHLSNTTFYRNVARAVSRRKNSNLFRPIKNLNFALEMERVPPNFLIGDLFLHERRHLIFATERMVGLLARAKTWFIDKCEGLCKPPFTQLMIIHTNIKRDRVLKQVPVLFALMSGKKRKDYARIFNLIKNIMPDNFKVHRIISDFQKSLWKAVRQVFPNVTQRGCLYHWTTSLWRQLQSLGLQEIYLNDNLIHNICRQLMALPFIPPQEIPVQFQILTEKVPDDFLALHSFVEYIRAYWIENHHWPIETWNVFLQPIQASNDCGGLHDRLNVATRTTAPYLYRLINLLHNEAEYIDTDVRFIEDSKSNVLHHNNFQGLSSRLNTIWADYMSGQKSCRKLLKSCARIHGPELYC